MYAIVKVGGKQYRVEKGDSLVVDRLRAKEGAELVLEPLLFRPDDAGKTVIGGEDLEKVKVEATVAGHERGKKIHVLKFKPKRGYKRRTGHRSDLTRLEIKDIRLLRRRPATKGEAGAGAEKAATQPSKARAPRKTSGKAAASGASRARSGGGARGGARKGSTKATSGARSGRGKAATSRKQEKRDGS
jgi:large subunit ribosomal protein L21